MEKIKTITKKEAWGIALKTLETVEFERKDEVIEKIKLEISLVEKKALKSSSKTNEDMEKLMSLFLEEFKNQTKPVTVTELVQNANNELVHNISSTQKASAVVKKLKDSKQVLARTNKKRTEFYLPTLELEELN